MINREGFYIGEFDRECTKCGVIFRKTSKTVTLCNQCNSERVKSGTVEYKMHQRAKVRAKILNREFNLEVDDIKIPTHCPILGVKLTTKIGSGGAQNSPSLDRINSTKGYTKDNIQVISSMANRMKSDASKDQLLTFANWVLGTFGTD